MAPRTSLLSNSASSEQEMEVICPLPTKEGKPCRKKCVGDKRFRSMQEHIRRAHPERYIPKLPATEESFHIMINSPPNKNVLAGQNSESESPYAAGPSPVVAPDVPRPDNPGTNVLESERRDPTPAGVSSGSSVFETIMGGYEVHHPNLEDSLLLRRETPLEHVTGLSAASVPDFASAPTLDSERMSAITDEYHSVTRHGSAARENPQAVTSEMRHSATAPPSVWDQDGFREIPDRGLGFNQLFGAEPNDEEIINGNYPFFDGDCTLFPSNSVDSQTFDFVHYPQARDDSGNWIAHEHTGLRGLGPDDRSAMEVTSINALHRKRAMKDQLRLVSDWLRETPVLAPLDPNSPIAEERRIYQDDGIRAKEIELGSHTENVAKPGQAYYLEEGGNLTAEDYEIMDQTDHWNDVPSRFSILPAGTTPRQPESSSAAMARFERACGDEESILSAAATCGTRRASSPCFGDTEAAEGSLTGTFLRRLATTEDKPPRADVLRTLRGITRDPVLKRKQTASLRETPENAMRTDPPDLAIMKYPATKTSDNTHKLSVTTNLENTQGGGMVRAVADCDEEQMAQRCLDGPSPSHTAFRTTGEAQCEHGQTIMPKLPHKLDAALTCPMPGHGPLPRQIGLARLQLEILTLNDSHPATKDWKNRREDTANFLASESMFPDVPKFACPVQAYATTKILNGGSCRQGFVGIDELKCHLMQAHAPSSSRRLGRLSLKDGQAPGAPPILETEFEADEAGNIGFFMTNEALRSLETFTCSVSEEETWWQIFQLVVPGLEGKNTASLRAEYSPYHVVPDADFMVPAITLSSSTFESSQLGTHSTGVTGNGTNGLKSPPTPPLSRPATKTLSVPLFEVPPRSGVEAKAQGLYTPPQTTSTEGSDGFESPRANSPPTPMSLWAAQMPCSIPIQHTHGNKTAETLVHQSYERLHERSMQKEAENVRLRQTNKAAWAELGCVGSLLEDLLSAVNMPEELQNKLGKAAQMVAAVKDSL